MLEAIALGVGDVLEHLLGALERGLAVELDHEVALGARDLERRAHGATALRHDDVGAQGTAQRHRDPALARAPVVEDQVVGAGARPGARQPAHHPQPGGVAVEAGQHALDVEAERVAEQQHQLGALDPGGEPRELGRIIGGLGPALAHQRERRDPDPGQPPGQHRKGGGALDLVLGADHAVPAHSQQAAGGEALAQLRRGTLGAAHVGGGVEGERQVDRPVAQPLADAVRGLAGRGVRVGGARGRRGPARRGRGGSHGSYTPRRISRAITRRWISLVPSPISISLTSRCMRSTGMSRQ